MNKIILASSSKRRQDLLRQIGITFEVIHSDVSEVNDECRPDVVVRKNSRIKVSSVIKKSKTGAIIIGADTVVSLDGKVMGKPKDRDEAVWMLQKLQNNIHTVCTGVYMIKNEAPFKSVSFCEQATVHFRSITDAQINAYVDTGEPYDKAGGYGIQGFGALFTSRIEGDYYTIVGLPVCRLVAELEKLDASFKHWERFIV